jgi:hypothetical protein
VRRRALKLASPQLGLGVDCGGPDRARLAKYNAWFTPQGVALQVCRYLQFLVCSRLLQEPLTILDNQAGGGVWGWAMRKVWAHARRLAVEIREEELEHLRHNYDDVEIADYLAADMVGKRPVDAIITNPSFEDALLVADRSLYDLHEDGWLALLVRLTWGDNDDVATWMREHPPVACLELDGRIEFAVGINPETGEKYGQDSMTYRVFVWQKHGRVVEGAIDYERYLKLPRLTDAERKWMRVAGLPVRPGTEYLHGL